MGEDKDWRILDHISWGANCYRRLDYSGRRAGRGACCCRHSWTWFHAGNNPAAHERLSRIRDAAIARDRSEHPF
jgi:hypothetical protein